MGAAQPNVLQLVVYGLIICILVFVAFVIGLIVIAAIKGYGKPSSGEFWGSGNRTAECENCGKEQPYVRDLQNVRGTDDRGFAIQVWTCSNCGSENRTAHH